MPSRCLLTVHAHPDDESSKGAGTVARYHAEGVRTVLVTCTGGEEGDILNPAMDRPEVRADLAGVRRRELEAAAQVIGYDRYYLLGYRDSGMPGSESNSNPESFAAAPLDEAVGRLVRIIRRERPQVLVTYPKEQNQYPHPDHLRVNEISEVAFEAAGDPALYPDSGEPWQPARLCYIHWSAKRMIAMHAKFLELGLESPYDAERVARWSEEPTSDLAKVVVDISAHASVTRLALLAHATQVDPTSRHWFGLPPEVAAEAWHYDEYHLIEDRTGESAAAEEDDLFAGIRQPASR
jgi:mycothiol S-conjugate amidase